MRSKSTLLRVLAGKLTPTSGTLSVNGIAVRKPVPGMCAFVPQDDIMLSQLTVREAVEHAAFMRLPAAMSKRLKRRVAGRGLFDVSFNLIDSQLIAVLDLLDIHKVCHFRLFREACVCHRGNYVKDLGKLGRPLKDIIIIDNSPASYLFNPENAVPIDTYVCCNLFLCYLLNQQFSWFDDPNDTELLDLIPFLEDISTVDDVCSVLSPT